MTRLTLARSELIMGGQKSGKSRRAELLARDWLGQSAHHRALMIATAQAWDDEMRQRIQRHRADRAERVPGMTTLEEPLQLAPAIAAHSQPDTLIVVDCLTLWLTNLLMPAEGAMQTDVLEPHPLADALLTGNSPAAAPALASAEKYVENRHLALMDKAWVAPLLEAINQASGPLVLVGNEIGLGVIPLGREVRAFVDALGLLNQSVAGVCQRVTMMAAGLPLTLKEVP